MIETKNLSLYIVTKERYKALSKGLQVEGIIPHANWPSKIIKTLIKEDLKKYKNSPELSIWGTYILVLKETGEIIGDVGYKGPPDFSGEVEIGYGIEAPHRKCGYGLEAAEALISFAFSKHTVDAVIAECRIGNVPSEKIIDALGMEEYEEDHKYRYYRITREEFEKMKK